MKVDKILDTNNSKNRTVTSLSGKYRTSFTVLIFNVLVRSLACVVIFSEDWGLGILYLSSKFELDRCTNNEDLLSEQQNWNANKDTKSQTHSYTFSKNKNIDLFTVYLPGSLFRDSRIQDMRITLASASYCIWPSVNGDTGLLHWAASRLIQWH